jgi:MYXO-CTERM domain-containing protein
MGRNVTMMAFCRRVAAPAALLLSLGCGESDAPSENEMLTESRELAVESARRWFETQELLPPWPEDLADLTEVAEDRRFGCVVTVSGTTAFVGKKNRVFAYTFSNGEWGDEQELDLGARSASSDLVDSVAISGPTAIVGTARALGGGAAFIFLRVGTNWTPVARLTGDPTLDNEEFGTSVAIDGELAVVGEPGTESAYVFAHVGATWLQQKQLRTTDRSREFGSAVAISGNLVVVGAPASGETPELLKAAGKVYVYTKPRDLSGSWREEIFVSVRRQDTENFGRSVAVSGDTIFVGAPGGGNATAFTKQGSTWSAQPLVIRDTLASKVSFGRSLALSGDRVVIGAPELERDPFFTAGGAFVFVRVETGWIQEQSFITDDVDDFGALFGQAVGISGGTMIVGAPGLGERGVVQAHRLLGADGSACDENSACGNGHCVSGICCENACDDECEECSTGKCEPKQAGSRGSPACGLLLCNGRDPACPRNCLTSDDCVETHQCNDEDCVPRATEGEPCMGPEDCLSRNCVGGQCTGRAPIGSACENGSSCESGICADGFCCDRVCPGQCEACDVEGHEGRCTGVEGQPHGSLREPCAGTDRPCRGRCDGETTDVCFYEPADTICGRACEGNSESVSTCDSQGACVPGVFSSCRGLVCDEETSACKSSCRTDRDCAGELSCWENGKCALSPRCTADDTQSESAPDGALDDCWPYTCGSLGSCLESCTAPDQCASPNVCTNQRCVPLPSDDSGGCGCRTPARKSGTPLPIVGSLVLFALALRRSRRRAVSSRGAS